MDCRHRHKNPKQSSLSGICAEAVCDLTDVSLAVGAGGNADSSWIFSKASGKYWTVRRSIMDEQLRLTFEKFLPEFAEQRARDLRDHEILKTKSFILDMIQELGGSTSFTNSVMEMAPETFSSQMENVMRMILNGDMDSAIDISRT